MEKPEVNILDDNPKNKKPTKKWFKQLIFSLISLILLTLIIIIILIIVKPSSMSFDETYDRLDGRINAYIFYNDDENEDFENLETDIITAAREFEKTDKNQSIKFKILLSRLYYHEKKYRRAIDTLSEIETQNLNKQSIYDINTQLLTYYEHINEKDKAISSINKILVLDKIELEDEDWENAKEFLENKLEELENEK